MFGMPERREDLTLDLEAVQEVHVNDGRPHDLDRDFLGESAVGALRPEDGAHAAFADLLDQPKGAEL